MDLQLLKKGLIYQHVPPSVHVRGKALLKPLNHVLAGKDTKMTLSNIWAWNTMTEAERRRELKKVSKLLTTTEKQKQKFLGLVKKVNPSNMREKAAKGAERAAARETEREAQREEDAGTTGNKFRLIQSQHTIILVLHQVRRQGRSSCVKRKGRLVEAYKPRTFGEPAKKKSVPVQNDAAACLAVCKLLRTFALALTTMSLEKPKGCC